MKLFNQILLIILILATQTWFCQGSDEISGKVKGKIKAENTEGMIELTAKIENSSNVFYSLNYLLIAIKKDENGNTSSNKQEGKFVVEPHEAKNLSKININLSKRGALKTFLFIRDVDNKILISKDSLVINGGDFGAETVSFIPENKVELNGFTIDETRTKLGKYFYDQFFLNALQQDFKFAGTVLITEIPGFGRNTRVTVTYNDEEIYQFTTTPDEEIIDQESKAALALLNQYILSKNGAIKNL